jgi:hypothetical protein
VEVQLHALTSALDVDEGSASRYGQLLPGKEPQYPLDRRLGGHQNRSRHNDEDEKSHLPLGIEHWSSSPSLVTTLTDLPRLRGVRGGYAKSVTTGVHLPTLLAFYSQDVRISNGNVKFSCPCVVPNRHHAMKASGGVEVQLHSFLFSCNVSLSDKLQAPATFPPWKEPPIPDG